MGLNKKEELKENFARKKGVNSLVWGALSGFVIHYLSTKGISTDSETAMLIVSGIGAASISLSNMKSMLNYEEEYNQEGAQYTGLVN